MMAMTQRSAAHDSFTIKRTFVYPREFVFAAWSSADAKAHWFAGPNGWQQKRREMDFRVGGHECVAGLHVNGRLTQFDAHYFEIVPNERIVYAYEMHLDGVRISVSLATIEFTAKGRSTELTITEQGVFLDEFKDGGSRKQGTELLIGQLEQALARQRAG
jgi:uncharacterized protein YndB with AHSA1/START domain